jgi:hypothetical protein
MEKKSKSQYNKDKPGQRSYFGFKGREMKMEVAERNHDDHPWLAPQNWGGGKKRRYF